MKRIFPEICEEENQEGEGGGKKEESPQKKAKQNDTVCIYFLFKGQKHAIEIDPNASSQQVFMKLMELYNKVLVPPEKDDASLYVVVKDQIVVFTDATDHLTWEIVDSSNEILFFYNNDSRVGAVVTFSVLNHEPFFHSYPMYSKNDKNKLLKECEIKEEDATPLEILTFVKEQKIDVNSSWFQKLEKVVTLFVQNDDCELTVSEIFEEFRTFKTTEEKLSALQQKQTKDLVEKISLDLPTFAKNGSLTKVGEDHFILKLGKFFKNIRNLNFIEFHIVSNKVKFVKFVNICNPQL